MESDALSLLRKQMQENATVFADDVARGRAADFPEYKRMCGVIYGLGIAIQLVDEMEQRLLRQNS